MSWVPRKQRFQHRLFCLLCCLILFSSCVTVWFSFVHDDAKICSDYFTSLCESGGISDAPHLTNNLMPGPEAINVVWGRKPRLLLGIASRTNDFAERQRRHLIRNTYLDFDRIHSQFREHRVCSLQDFLNSDLPSCQMVYVFLLGPQHQNADQKKGSVLATKRFENNEKDVVYLNVNETDGVAKRWGFFEFAVQIKSNHSLPLVAYTDTCLFIKPPLFWENSVFHLESMHQNLYGGLLTFRESCVDKKCVSLQRNSLMRRFVIVSKDVAAFIVEQNQPILERYEFPDVAIANVLNSYPNLLNEVKIDGITTVTSKSVGAFLSAYDRFKDSLVDYQQPKDSRQIQNFERVSQQNHSSPRILLGIFSMDSQIELERRNMIRKTYLQAFVDTETPRRICSLWQIQEDFGEGCEVVYAFIVGGNASGAAELVEPTASTGPIFLNDSFLPHNQRLGDHNNSDIVYLNIRENGKEGKSQTYFRFALSTLERIHFDYFGKIDSDTLLFPDELLHRDVNKLPTFPNNVRIYAGDYRIRPSTSSLNLGPAYMGGQFYILSPDLAAYITSTKCNRSALAVYSEDQSIGNFIHSMNVPIHRIRIRLTSFEHPIKRVDRLKTLWKKYQHRKRHRENNKN